MCGYYPVKFFSRSYTATGKNFPLTFPLYLHICMCNVSTFLSFSLFGWSTRSVCEVHSIMLRDLVQTNKLLPKNSVTLPKSFNLLLLGRGPISSTGGARGRTPDPPVWSRHPPEAFLQRNGENVQHLLNPIIRVSLCLSLNQATHTDSIIDLGCSTVTTQLRVDLWHLTDFENTRMHPKSTWMI